MKKLIALTLSLAIILCFSFAVMAAPVELTNNGTEGSDDNGTQSIATTFDADTMTFVTTVTGVTDQATLLAYSGDELSTENGTNIEYIDQITVGTTTEFTYKLKTDPTANATYTVKVGGSNLATPLSQFVTPIVQTAPTTFTISGTVANAVFDTFTSEYFEDLGDLTAQEQMAVDFNEAQKTIVKLIPFSDLHLFVKYIFEVNETDESNVVATAVVDSTTGDFELTDIANSSYAMIIQRDGYLPRMIKVDVTGEDIDLGNKPIIPGDLKGGADFSVDGLDIAIVISKTCYYAEQLFYPGYDLAVDASVDGSDIALVIANSGKTHATYGEDESIDVDILVEQ